MDLPQRFKNAFIFISFFILSPMGIVLICTIFTPRYSSFVQSLKQFVQKFIDDHKNFIFLMIFLADLVSQMLSGRVGPGYLHYLIISLPAAFIVSLIVCNIKAQMAGGEYFGKNKEFIYTATLFLIACGTIIYFNYYVYTKFYYLTNVKNALILSIQKNTNPQDKIYVSWADAWIYVASKRFSFTRFFYPNPVLQTAYGHQVRLDILSREYMDSPPKILVDWNKELFGSNISIEYLSNKFKEEYFLLESNSFYSIYKRKIGK